VRQTSGNAHWLVANSLHGSKKIIDLFHKESYIMMFFVASPLPSVLGRKKLKAFPSGQIIGVISKEDRPYCLLRPNKAKEDLKTLLPVNNGFNLPLSLSLSSPSPLSLS